MNASCKKILPFLSPKVTVPHLDLVQKADPQILIPEKEYLGLKCDVAYWQGMHKKSLLREEALKKAIKKQAGQIRDLKARVFGKKSEKKSSSSEKDGTKSKKTKRPRGQLKGCRGHGRTIRPNLPKIEESIHFPDVPKCSKCGTIYVPHENKNKNPEIIEIEVKAHKRIFIRDCMKKNCSCKGIPNTVTVPAPPKVIPKSPYGISIWASVLLHKFCYCQPTNRLLNQYSELGLPISAGSITGGLQVLKKLFDPVYEALKSQQMTEDIFHNDETSWKVFEGIDGKIGNRWWLWVSRSASVVFFQIAPGRGTDVPLGHFETIKHGKIIVICDRYSAYKSLARQLSFVILAFCWAHVRRDFLDAAKKYPELEDWALNWVEQIGELYHINNQRYKQFDPKLPVQWQSELFKNKHKELVKKMDVVLDNRDNFIDTYESGVSDSSLLSEIKYKILTSLKNHWEGLSVFVEHPEVPMDNNKAENSIRNPVTGRKSFYGSGSLWSSKLAATMFSIFQTMVLSDINCNHWLRLYLTACAENKGKAPEDLSSFLPWKMDDNRRQQLSKPFDTS